MANYKIGNIDPVPKPDKGAGVWNSESTTWEMRAKWEAIYQIIPHAYLLIGDDATHHMLHYLGNTGKDLTIDLEGLIEDVVGERKVFENELTIARKYVESLNVGTHQITSDKVTSGPYITKSESWNWFFAVGGYSIWGKGTATVSKDAAGQKACDMDFEYKFFDRYNWDGGKSVEIFGITITDEFMGRFHREGLAREFNMNGSIKRNVKWTGATTATPTITKPGGR